ncbi:MAG: helix-turn-helix transcriptional regulator [Pseudomonadota bacterium]
MIIKSTSITPMKLGQDFITVGLKIQKRELPLNYVMKKIDVSALEEMNNSTDWEKDITPLDRISALMEIQSISQSDLSKKMKVSRQFISGIFNGRKKLTTSVAKKIASILGVKVSAIL